MGKGDADNDDEDVCCCRMLGEGDMLLFPLTKLALRLDCDVFRVGLVASAFLGSCRTALSGGGLVNALDRVDELSLLASRGFGADVSSRGLVLRNGRLAGGWIVFCVGNCGGCCRAGWFWPAPVGIALLLLLKVAIH